MHHVHSVGAWYDAWTIHRWCNRKQGYIVGGMYIEWATRQTAWSAWSQCITTVSNIDSSMRSNSMASVAPARSLCHSHTLLIMLKDQQACRKLLGLLGCPWLQTQGHQQFLSACPAHWPLWLPLACAVPAAQSHVAAPLACEQYRWK